MSLWERACFEVYGTDYIQIVTTQYEELCGELSIDFELIEKARRLREHVSKMNLWIIVKTHLCTIMSKTCGIQMNHTRLRCTTPEII